VRAVLADPKIKDSNEKSHYWLLSSALARFVEKEGALPLSGKLPDMTSTTDFYITLQNIYQEKAHADLEEFTTLLHQVMLERGVFKESISAEEIKLFCSNAQTLEVVRMRSPQEELTNPIWDDFADNFSDPDSSCQWFIVVRAVESFRLKHGGRYPGHTEAQIDSDFPVLRAEVDAILR
jgi:amyloid beta precursor protein binding protein 1